MESRIVKRADGGTEVHCAVCDVTLTWFTYRNVWAEGRLAYRICHNERCESESQATTCTS